MNDNNMKELILEHLKKLHQDEGIAFVSEEDAMEYYQKLIELIETLSTNTNAVPSGSSMSTAIGEVQRIEKEIMRSLEKVSDAQSDATTLRLERERISILMDIFYPPTSLPPHNE